MQIDSAGAANILDDLAVADTAPDTLPDAQPGNYFQNEETAPATMNCPDTERNEQQSVDPSADTERAVGAQPADIQIADVSSQIKLAVSATEM